MVDLIFFLSTSSKTILALNVNEILSCVGWRTSNDLFRD